MIYLAIIDFAFLLYLLGEEGSDLSDRVIFYLLYQLLEFLPISITQLSLVSADLSTELC
jgi:hypothetical protein